jgi:hypothetical protein
MPRLKNLQSLKRSRFSRANLAIFAIIFASIGGYLLYSSFASGPTLPSGVTLQQVDGGSNYYCAHSFTYACNAGWDDPSFFPIGAWLSPVHSQSDIDLWRDLNLNTIFAPSGPESTNLPLIKSNGLNVVLQSDESGRFSNVGTETVGMLACDECGTYAGAVSDPLSSISNALQDNRFWWTNNTWNFIAYGDIGGVPAAQVLSNLINTPNNSQRHLDMQSIDLYWESYSMASSPGLHQGGVIYNLGRDMTPDEMRRAYHYGDIVDRLRAYQVGYYPAPVLSYIENGGPMTEDTTAGTYIAPAELNATVWSSVIHGARGIVYFNHTFAGPAQSQNNFANIYYQTVQAGQTISIYDQAKATNTAVKQLAPVINSPTANNYVSVSPAASSLGGFDVMAKYQQSSDNFYVFSMSRGSEAATSIPATYTVAGGYTGSVGVVNENRSVQATNGVFSDTFANGNTVHIYQIPNSASATDPSTNYFTPYCKSDAVSVVTAAAARTQISLGKNVCLTVSITGDINLSGLNTLTSQVYFGTAVGVSIAGSVDVHSSKFITLNIRASSVNANGLGTQHIVIDNSKLGGTGPAITQRVHDDLVYVANGCTDCAITHSELAYTYGDWKTDPNTADPNTGYGCHCNTDLDNFHFVGNWVHDIAADGLQIGGGNNVVIDRNEIGPVGENDRLPNADHTGYGAGSNTQHSDNIQITGNGANWQVTNNYLHDQGYYNYGDGNGLTATSNSGIPYIHGGSSGALLFSNNLMKNALGRTEVCGLGTGGVDRSNITISNNTFYDLGREFASFPGFEWDCDTGAGNTITNNIAVDPDNGFANDGQATAGGNNLYGQLSLVTLDVNGNCTSSNCNPTGQTIGYRCPTGVWWCDVAPTGPTANLWVDTTINTNSCVRHAVQITYSVNGIGDTDACSTIQAAVAACTPGDTIRMKVGSYGAQTITTARTSPGCTVIGDSTAPGVTLAGFTNNVGNWFEIQNVTINGGYSVSGTGSGTPHDITFRNVDFNGGGWYLSNCCTNIKMIGGRIHNVTDGGGPTAIEVQGTAASTPISSITFDGVEIDHTDNSTVGNHYEAFRTQGFSSDINIRNSYFHDNGNNSSQIFISSFTGGTANTPGPITIEGNYFAPPVTPTSGSAAFVDINGNLQGLACPDLTVRNNTAQSSLLAGVGGSNFWNCTTPTNVKVTANIMPVSSKVCDATYSYNLFIASSSMNCGTGDQTVASSSAAGILADGFHINTSSPAAGAGNLSSCPSTDRDGDTRPLPLATACDIGADEVSQTGGTSPPPPPPGSPKPADINTDGSVNITDLSLLLSSYGQTTTNCITNNTYVCDIKNDTPPSTVGHIDIFDLSLLLSGYGS